MRRQHHQLDAFSATAEDLPLFSGTAQPAQLEVFAPAEEAQPISLFDRREYIALPTKPSLSTFEK